MLSLPSNEETKPILKRNFKNRRVKNSQKQSCMCLKHFRETDINVDKMKQLLPNAVPITSNYEEITLWEQIIKISNDDSNP
jgi:hypothetical protein